jgi:rhomboid protease GluP
MGASGVVYLLGSTWLTLFALLARDYRLRARLLRAFGVAFAVFLPTEFHANISYGAHLIGFALGIISALLFWVSYRSQFARYEIAVEDIPEVFDPLEEDPLRAYPTSNLN